MNTQGVFDRGEGPNLVLLHGLFGSLSNWDQVAAAFLPEYRVVIPTFPFYAKNPFGRTGLDGLVCYLEALVREKGLEKLVLVGNSLGGHVALLYTLRNPDKVDRLVLTGSSGLMENLLGWSFPRLRDYNYISEKVRQIFFKKETVNQSLVDEIYSTVQSKRKLLPLISLARAAKQQHLSDDLWRIDVPTLLVWGLQDEITPLQMAYEFYAKISSSRLRLINNCGHAPMMEQPELFNFYLGEFLNQEKQVRNEKPVIKTSIIHKRAVA